MKLAFLDTETTGIEKPKIIQIAYQIDNKIETYLIKPPKPIEIGAMATHHITNKMVKDELEFIAFGHVIQEDLDKKILVAHNAEFDVQALYNEGIMIKEHICTYLVASYLKRFNFLDAEKLSLQYLRYYFEIDVVVEAHSADGDVRVLVQVFKKLKKLVEATKQSDKDVIEVMLDITKWMNKPENYVLHFGKHKDKALGAIYKEDGSYFDWCIKNLDDKKVVEKMELFLKGV